MYFFLNKLYYFKAKCDEYSKTHTDIDSILLIHCSAFFGSEDHVELDTNPGPGYNTPLLPLIPGDLLSAWPHRQFHTLPALLYSRAALSNSYPNACVTSREAVCTVFMMVFGMTQPGHEFMTYRVRGGHANH